MINVFQRISSSTPKFNINYKRIQALNYYFPRSILNMTEKQGMLALGSWPGCKVGGKGPGIWGSRFWGGSVPGWPTCQGEVTELFWASVPLSAEWRGWLSDSGWVCRQPGHNDSFCIPAFSQCCLGAGDTAMEETSVPRPSQASVGAYVTAFGQSNLFQSTFRPQGEVSWSPAASPTPHSIGCPFPGSLSCWLTGPQGRVQGNF